MNVANAVAGYAKTEEVEREDDRDIRCPGGLPHWNNLCSEPDGNLPPTLPSVAFSHSDAP